MQMIMVFSLISCPLFLLSQSAFQGNFPISNYVKMESGVGLQNWDIGVLENGNLLVANNGGLLKYDGVNWNLFSLPNKTIARSICIYDQNKVFVGGQDEIGFFDENFSFHSIRDLIPSEHLPLEDVWQIVALEDQIYFRSVNKIFAYNVTSRDFKVVGNGNPIISLISFNETIYFHDLYTGLISFNDQSKLYPGSELLRYKQVLNLVQFKEKTIVITESDGLLTLEKGIALPYNIDLNTFLTKNKLVGSYVINNNVLVLGTQFAGAISVDSTGKVAERYNKSNGLINNNVHTISLDHNKDLWIGTSNGLAEVQINSPITYLEPDPEKGSSFYDVVKFEGDIYFATNTGVYRSVENNGFRLLENSAGQAWGLDVIDHRLLIAHNNGPFVLNKDKSSLQLMSSSPGAWKFSKTAQEGFLYVGTYTGVDIYQKSGRDFKFYKKLEGLSESSRILESVKENELWVSHPYRGIFRITHDEDFNTENIQVYDQLKGLPSSLLNYIFIVNDELLVTAEKGIFYYDRASDKFEPYLKLNTHIDTSQNVRRLFEEPNGNIWFVAEQEVGVLRKQLDGSLLKEVFPSLLNQLVGGFEHISFIDDRVFVGTDQNIIIVDQNKNSSSSMPLVNFHEIRLTEKYDSMLSVQNTSLSHDQNAISFSYSSPEHDHGVLYQYNLIKNGENSLSQWTRETKKEFNNLPPGEYIFQLKSRSIKNLESEMKEFDFEIRPPWYLSSAAKLVYVLILSGFLFIIILVPRTRYKKDKEVLLEAKNQSDQELEKIKSEKLEAELASSTLHLVQKNETMVKIKSELEIFSEKISDSKLRKELKKVISVVNDDSKLDDDWESFSNHFDQVHTNFLSRLTKEYTQITPKDQRLCAYLRMNLSTKEIAPLMHISVRGVEISRYRLRKKMDLPTETNLNEFMMKY